MVSASFGLAVSHRKGHATRVSLICQQIRGQTKDEPDFLTREEDTTADWLSGDAPAHIQPGRQGRRRGAVNVANPLWLTQAVGLCRTCRWLQLERRFESSR
jgi:hypothetical protein